ncbi:Uu.00g102870.m01.CDS01 [Anthostomella pinea]|uniref:Uu.00g102870.m01.CDS01 n=1 Tax=Anthostomella pinea TaxID=933095 RepID=A0AAI8YFJ9_9PEZI|nr:Uu.00g102870.m01.CDS01 [Anthostomella pinea]
MAEPENFDEDLFADLYDDNDAAAPATAPAAPAAPAQSQPSEAITHPEYEQASEDVAQSTEENGYGNDYHEDNYDDDDDVDFNLGNGTTSMTAAPVKQEEAHTPTYHHTTRGPSAKEDG